MNLVGHNSGFQYHEKQNLIVIWAAKAACTVVNKMYYEEEGLLEEALEYHYWIHNFREKKNEERAKIRRNGLISQKSKYIQFVVNPYRRAVSSYIHAMRTNYAEMANNTKFNKNISFNQFIDLILNQKLKKNPHHSLQMFFLKKNIEYIKMENIKQLLPMINKKYNLNYKIKDSPHHIKTINLPDSFVGDLLWSDIDVPPKKYYNFYNEKIRKKIEIIYSSDIETFNYTWNEFINR